MIASYQGCPRYAKCNVNNCPLHPSYPNLPIDPEDRDTKCTLEKQVRFRIGSKYPDVLKYQGLTPSEWAGKQRFENLSDHEKDLIRDRAKSLKSPLFQSERIENRGLSGSEP